MVRQHNDSTRSSGSSSSKDIYYFGFGPIVHDMVRKRRDIEVVDIQPGVVYDYRLTFAIGGIANIVPKVGYEVHGLLMRIKSKDDWEKLMSFDSGKIPTIRTVVPYNAIHKVASVDGNNSGTESTLLQEEDSEELQSSSSGPQHPHNADDDFGPSSSTGAIQAYLIEHSENVEDTLLEAPIERLPQERYLKLIAQGMRKYKVDEDYVTDQIEACPFIPNRKPDDYFSFPVAKRVPKISFAKYLKMCARGSVEGDLYFILGTKVFRMGEHDPANPLAKWFETHGHGKDDCTYMVHLTVVDPEIPFLEDASQVADLHIQWAENHLCEVVEQYSMSATHVYTLAGKSDTSASSVVSPKKLCANKEDPTEGPDDVEILRLRRRRRRRCWIYRVYRWMRGSNYDEDDDEDDASFDYASVRFSTKTAVAP